MDRNRPLRIIHCVRAPIGGIFRHVTDLAMAQSDDGHEVGIICDASTGGAHEDALIKEVAPKLAFGVQRFAMERRIGASDLRLVLALLDRLRGLRPDILHGHGAKGGAYARVLGTVLRSTGRPVARIYCPHGGSLHFDPESREGRVYFGIERALERVTDGLVFVSDYEAAAYREKVGQPRVPARRIHNGLRPAEFEPVPPAPETADLFFAGMMRDLKGPQVLVEALLILESRYGLRPTVRMVGAGDDRPAYEARVAALGLADRVVFLDPMPTRRALAQGRILVVPSLAESLPYLVLEAAAASIPMVATRVGGIPEIFAERGSRLLQPGDPHLLAAGMAAALRHEAGASIDAAEFSAEIRERFDIGRMTREVEALYADATARRRRGCAAEPVRARPVGRLSVGES